MDRTTARSPLALTLTVLAAGVLLAVAASTSEPAAAAEPPLTVEEVMARHVAARGGRERWQAIESMKVTGSFTAFSRTHPFTLWRQRPDRYAFVGTFGDKPVHLAFDGETAWQVNPWYGMEWPLRLTGADRVVAQQDADFAPALFHYGEEGYAVELVGPGDLDGEAVITLRLTRPNATVETWHLDPESWLEKAREAPGSDFGTPMPQRSYYEDFREVAGVLIPHYVETEFYTRHLVMEVDEVAVDAPVDAALFRMPLGDEMARLAPLAGEWRVEVEERAAPWAEWTQSVKTSRIESLVDGNLLREASPLDNGGVVIRTLSYDRFRQRYVLTQIDDQLPYLDLAVGTFDAEGRLALADVEPATPWSDNQGSTYHRRTTISAVTADGFDLEHEISTDGGAEWVALLRQRYRRPEAPAANGS